MSSRCLDPLLRPRSIAVVGASARVGSPGNEALVNLRKCGYKGALYAVNPRGDAGEGIACYASLPDLPAIPEHVVIAVGDRHVEEVLGQVIALGVKAASLFSALQLEDDAQPPLRERVRQQALDSGLLLHGANCMGLFNFRDGVWLSGFDTRQHGRGGNVALLSQSGAGMSGILDCEERLDFCFAASTGQELCLSVEDYLDYVLDLADVGVVGLFLETSRKPQLLLAALQKAQRKNVPIVVLKVGRTALSARLAVSHSGAIAGTDASYQAVFDRYGVQRVDDMAQLASALIMFSRSGPVGGGALVSLHDSGGERQLAIDLADALGVRLAELSNTTVEKLEQLLDPGLPAINPLDAWGAGGEAAAQNMADCFTTLLADPGAALGAVVHDRAPGGGIYASYLDYLRAAQRDTGKPVFLVANHQGSGSDPSILVEAARAGLPVIDGLREFLVGVRCLLDYRDFRSRPALDPPVPVAQATVSRWRQRIQSGEALGEAVAGELLRDFGIPVLRGQVVSSERELEALQFEYPLVLKTAQPGIAHKSELGGVHLDLRSPQALRSAYRQMAAQLGPAALVFPMQADPGVEMLLGVYRDEQFGPVVLLGLGGVHAEIQRDAVALLAPFSTRCARRALGRLASSELLGEFRGRPALAVDAFCEAASSLSLLAVALQDCVLEIEINPLRLTVDSCTGLDALLVGARTDGAVLVE